MKAEVIKSRPSTNQYHITVRIDGCFFEVYATDQIGGSVLEEFIGQANDNAEHEKRNREAKEWLRSGDPKRALEALEGKESSAPVPLPQPTLEGTCVRAGTDSDDENLTRLVIYANKQDVEKFTKNLIYKPVIITLAPE